MRKILKGLGYNDEKYPTRVGGKSTKLYKAWCDMLHRCYSDSTFLHHPSYVKCTVSQNFKSYTFFHEWCQKQVGFNRSYTQLDKDILFKGNTVYSEDTCVFVPKTLNLLMVLKGDPKRGLPLGVTCFNSKYLVKLSLGGKVKHLGTFTTIEEAFQSYKLAKEEHIRAMALKFRDLIDSRVYETLMSYQVEFTD